MRKTLAPRRARVSISAIPKAKRTWSGTAIPISQSVFLIAVPISGSSRSM